VDDFSIRHDLIPVKLEPNDAQNPHFVDFDSINFRQILNYFRGNQTEYPGLTHDLYRFERILARDEPGELFELEVGPQTFYTEIETILKLPYFNAIYKFGNQPDRYLDMDPLIFSRILSFLRNSITHPICPEIIHDLSCLGYSVSVKATSVQTEYHSPGSSAASMYLSVKPQITFSKSIHQRYANFSQNMVTIPPEPKSECSLQELIYDINEAVTENDHLLKTMFLTLTTTYPIIHVSDIIQRVDLYLGDVKISDWGILMDSRSRLSNVESVVQHMIKGINQITIPLTFFFCTHIGQQIPMFTFNDQTKESLKLKVTLQPEHQKLLPDLVLKTQHISTVEHGYFKDMDTHQYLWEVYHKPMTFSSDDGVIQKTIVLETTNEIKYMIMVVTDQTTGERVNCNLHGTLTFGRKSVFQINSHQNQIEQFENNSLALSGCSDTSSAQNMSNIQPTGSKLRFNRKSNSSYHPDIWLKKWGLGPIDFYQPSGTFNCYPHGHKLKVDLHTDTPNVVFHLWFTEYNVFRICKGICAFAYINSYNKVEAEGDREADA